MSSALAEISPSVMDASRNVIAPNKPRLSLVQEKAMSLRFQGKGYKEIAGILDLKEGTIRNWFMTRGKVHDSYVAFCNEMMNPALNVMVSNTAARSVADKIKEAAPEALKSVIELSSNARKEEVRLNASVDILDRAGYMPVQKMISINAVEEMSITDLDNLIGGVLSNADKKKADEIVVVNEPVNDDLKNTVNSDIQLEQLP